MPFLVPKKQISLFFQSATAISLFKQESACQDFYIDRDAVAIVGFFTEEQIRLALTKYEARTGTLTGLSTNR